MYLVISTSLNATSRSRVLARHVHELLSSAHAADFVDLQELALPFCNAGDCYGHADVQQVAAQIEAAEGIVLATPVYNYNVSGAAKNLVELTGRAWSEKLVGFLCAAGGQGSYMSLMGLGNSLMLDFRTFVLPRFVYATGRDFDEEHRLTSDDVRERLGDFAAELVRVAEALQAS